MTNNRDLKRVLYFGLLFPMVTLNVWVLSLVLGYFQQIVTLLVVSAIVAFLLDYLVRALEKVRLPRSGAVILVLLATVAVLGITGVALVPLLITQSTELFGKVPGWLKDSRNHLDWIDQLAKRQDLPIDIQMLATRVSQQVESQSQELAKQVVGFALGTVSGVIDTILVIVMAFYMLLYGDQLWSGLMGLLPDRMAQALTRSLRENFHNFFLSQFVLALFMTVTLIPVFWLLKVPYEFLFALGIGIAELIPFIGATLGIGTVTLVLLFQNFWLAFWAGLAATILQQIRDNLIAPKIMGDFTGLNPIWIFVSLLLGLKIAGFLGVFIAVPIAGTIKATIDRLSAPSHTVPVIATSKKVPHPDLEDGEDVTFI